MKKNNLKQPKSIVALAKLGEVVDDKKEK